MSDFPDGRINAMNNTQKRILIVVALLVLIMLAYPPVMRGPNGMGFAWIFDLRERYLRVDVAQLMAQWLGTLIIGGILFALNKEREMKMPRMFKTTPDDQVVPARPAILRATDWIAPGFVVGFFIVQGTFISNFERRLGGGLLFAIVVYLIAVAYYKIRSPIDRGHGGAAAIFKRTLLVTAFTAVAGIAMAIFIPAAIDRFRPQPSLHFDSDQ